MGLSFEKVAACGNAFILLDQDPDPADVRTLCSARYGLGADGLLVFKPDAMQLDHYDPDGSRSFCLNGARAALAALHQSGRVPAGGKLHSEGVDMPFTINGHVSLELPRKPYRVCISQGVPGWFLDVGNPQFVTTQDIGDFPEVARKIRWDAQFSDGVNVNMVTREGDLHRIRTFERGVEGLTLACGSGMYAAACVLFGQENRSRVTFQPDGKGAVVITAAEDRVRIEGPTQRLAAGEWLC